MREALGVAVLAVLAVLLFTLVANVDAGPPATTQAPPASGSGTGEP